MSPTWDELAKAYNSKPDSEIKIAKVDCTTSTELCSQYGVSGYPTLKLLTPRGTIQRYEGKRDFQGFSDFIKKVLADDKIKESRDKEDADYAAKKKKEAEEKEKAEKEVKKTDDEAAESMVESLTQDNYLEVLANTAVFVKFFAPWCGHCKALAPTWEAIGKEFSENDMVVIAEVNCVTERAICKEYGIKSYPQLLWLENGEQKEKYSGERTFDGLRKYIGEHLLVKDEEMREEKWMAREGTLKSSFVPGTVLDLETTEEFMDYIKENLVFVKFYAPWCGHCKRLAPTFSDLAAELKDKQVTIAKVDCTAGHNICEKNGVPGYPTLKIFYQGIPITAYTGDRSLASLLTFVEEHLEKFELTAPRLEGKDEL